MVYHWVFLLVRRFLIILLRNSLFLFFIFFSSLASAQDNEYLQQLQSRSRELNLAQRQEWLNLLHFKPYPLWPNGRSLADGAEFFNAPDGKTNPEAELEATLAAFFSDRQESNAQQNPQCSFIARYHWLDAQLKFDNARLPRQRCLRFDTWRAALNPNEATLVFPAAYLNNPASMYGHTLIRIDAKDQDENTRLLAYAIGYAASTDETNGLTFAIKGLMGGYPGVYSIQPYYLKVREYNDIENRDVWEYRLNLTAEEIDRLLMHVWELGPIRFDYYFFDENCAYHLLALLEVARPGLELTDQFRWWAIPSDTVRAVVKQPGLLRQAVFRPSNATVIQQRMATLSEQQRQLAKELTEGKKQARDADIAQLTGLQQAQTLELGYDYLAYLRARKGDTPEMGKRARDLLLARSHIQVADTTPKIDVPATRPDQGHNTSRIGLGWGVMDGQHYQEISMRPSYHDQNDPEGGYTRGAQIQFFNLALRRYENDTGVRVEEFVPIDIYSLSPSNDYFQAMSWKINAGWTRKRFAEGHEPLVARVNAGAGKTWEVTSKESGAAAVYAFVDSTLEASSEYSRHYAWGIGPALGVMGDLSSRWRVNAYARVQRFGLGELHTASELTLVQRYSIGAQSALRLDLARKQEFEMLWTDVRIAWQQFF